MTAESLQGLSVWSVGHSDRSFEELLALLQAEGVEGLADVRRLPGSRRQPWFARQELETALAEAGVAYLHIPELGGRRKPRPDSPHTAWRVEGFRGYADHMETDEFREGMDRLLVLARERPTAMMCAEAVWWRCHRQLIADWLKVRGARVLHILGPDRLDEHPWSPAARVEGGRLTYEAEITSEGKPQGPDL